MSVFGGECINVEYPGIRWVKWGKTGFWSQFHETEEGNSKSPGVCLDSIEKALLKQRFPVLLLLKRLY